MADIAALLAQKEELDRRNTDALNMASYDRWIADALAALLRTEQEASPLCRLASHDPRRMEGGPLQDRAARQAMDHRRVRRRAAATGREIPHRHAAPAGALPRSSRPRERSFPDDDGIRQRRGLRGPPRSRQHAQGRRQKVSGPRADPADRPRQPRGRRPRRSVTTSSLNPEDAAIFPWAAEIAGWYWSTHELNRHADRDDVRAATKAINGGLNGLRDRTAYLDQAKRALA